MKQTARLRNCWFARGSLRELTRPIQICERAVRALTGHAPGFQSAGEAFYDRDLGWQDQTFATLEHEGCMADKLKFPLRHSSSRITMDIYAQGKFLDACSCISARPGSTPTAKPAIMVMARPLDLLHRMGERMTPLQIVYRGYSKQR